MEQALNSNADIIVVSRYIIGPEMFVEQQTTSWEDAPRRKYHAVSTGRRRIIIIRAFLFIALNSFLHYSLNKH